MEKIPDELLARPQWPEALKMSLRAWHSIRTCNFKCNKASHPSLIEMPPAIFHNRQLDPADISPAESRLAPTRRKDYTSTRN